MLNLNPNENIFMKAQEQPQQVYAVGIGAGLTDTSWMQPYAVSNEPSRRQMTNNPAFTTGYVPTTPQTVQAFGSYPPAMPAVTAPSVTPTGLNQSLLTPTTSTGMSAVARSNPWDTSQAQQFSPLPVAAPTAIAAQTYNQFGYPTTTAAPQVMPVLGNPADVIVNSYSQNWAKRDPAVWPAVATPAPTAPQIDWGLYSNGCVNGIYAPQNAAVAAPQYPVQFQTTAINNDWNAICETNFKATF